MPLQIGLKQAIGWPKLDDPLRLSLEPKERKHKKDKTMTPTTSNGTAKVTRTVFDLTAFDDVKLVKPAVALPNKPTSIEEALAAVGNNAAKLLDVIHEGLVAEAKAVAYDNIEGFQVVNEDGSVGEVYTGKYADEDKGKLINNAILSLAKMQGYDKSLPPERKRELKEKATSFLRDNPAMLATIQG